MQTICPLDYAAGHVRRCPGDTCPVWVDDHCAVARRWEHFGSNSDVAQLLRDLRSDLASRSPGRAVRRFHPPGLA
jgi:hypothetical protein